MRSQPTAQLDQIFFALSDSTRRGILARLAEGTTTIGELAKPYNISSPAISRHMRILEQAGLVDRKKSGRQHHCSLSPVGLQSAEAWINYYRKFWETRLDALEDLLRHQNSKN